MQKRVYISWYGCNRRLLELKRIKDYLIQNGYVVVNEPKKANYILVSTCAFKEKEENYSISKLRELLHCEAKLLVYGCLPDISPAKYKEFSYINHIAPKEIEKVDDFFEDIATKFSEISSFSTYSSLVKKYYLKSLLGKIFNRDTFLHFFYNNTSADIKEALKSLFLRFNGKYNLFICRGCRGKCTYCAINRAIGKVISKPIDSVINEFHKGVIEGYKDFIILGDDPGCYGTDINTTLPNLLSKILEELNKHLEEKRRKVYFNINEIHPKWLLYYKEELLSLFKSRFFKSILCPIQSGSDRILELMQREHDANSMREFLKELRTINPEIQLNTQIIIGFPSESDDDFYKTLNFIKDVQFNYVVIFPYHDKENTIASQLNNKIPRDIIEQRIKIAKHFFKKGNITVYFKCP